MDALNCAINPSSTATSALGAVGRGEEMREVAEVLITHVLVPCFNNVNGNMNQLAGNIAKVCDTVLAVHNNMNDMKRKHEEMQDDLETNKKQVTEQNEQLIEQKKQLMEQKKQFGDVKKQFEEQRKQVGKHLGDVKKMFVENEKQKKRFDNEYAANWNELDIKFAEMNNRLQQLEAGAAGAAGASTISASTSGAPASGAPLVENSPSLAFIDHKFKYAFDNEMRYIYTMPKPTRKNKFIFQARTPGYRTYHKYCATVNEAKRMRVLWCAQYPQSPMAQKARKLYNMLTLC